MPFSGPSEVIAQVLRRLRIDPNQRILPFDQDPEYTACRAEELPAYLDLYRSGTVDAAQRAVLCCFLLEGLNDFCSEGYEHPQQGEIFDALLDAGEAHSAELDYWTNTSDPDPENWWPIAEPLLRHRAVRAKCGDPGR